MTKAIFAGSFDPPTYGHLNIIERSQGMFDCIDVVVAQNPNKKYLFSCEQRFDFMCSLTKQWQNVQVHICDRLIVDYAHETGANVLLRGIRNSVDFAYEFDLAMMNKTLRHDIETLFIPTVQKFVILKSSSIKELASFKADVSGMVPPIVEEALKKIYQNQK